MQEQRNIWPSAPSSRTYTDTSSGLHTEDTLTQTDDWIYTNPSRSSVRRYQNTVERSTPRTVVRVTTHHELPPIQRASLLHPQQTQAHHAPVLQNRKARQHWLFEAGMCLLIMLFGWLLLSIVAHWCSVLLDDWHYGKPRTYQTDADVGHGGVNHFTVENLGGHILVTEVLLSDPAKAKIYVGPTLSGTDAALAPATLSFQDVNGDGLPDMIITVENNKYVFLGSKDGFHPQMQQGSVSNQGENV